QAEDGIRDFHVTGVQTCALPILSRNPHPRRPPFPARVAFTSRRCLRSVRKEIFFLMNTINDALVHGLTGSQALLARYTSDLSARSEERRVGKEGRSRGAR